MVRLEKVRKSYGRGDAVIRALDGVTLTVPRGGFVIITGPSGSGKTTLLNIIGGMTRPAEGSVMVAGQDVLSMPDHGLSRFRAVTIGFAFQFQGMLPALTVMENLLLPRRFAGKRDPGRASELIEAMGLAGRGGAYAHELSAGQQRRACIARALINEPALLLCDEPTGDLDPDTEAAIMEVISRANRDGATVLMTTHNHALKSYGDRSLGIVAGKTGGDGA